jgi:hypothetical protein
VTLAGAATGLTQRASTRIPFDGPFQTALPAGQTGIPAGDYTVDVGAFGPNDAYLKELTYNDLKLADGVLRIAPGASGTLGILMARGTASLTVGVTDTDGKPVPNATVILVPDSVTTVPLLARFLQRGQTDQNGSFTSRPLMPGRYRVLATAQAVRWDVPDDLERILLVMFQAKEVELASKSALAVTLQPVPVY